MRLSPPRASLARRQMMRAAVCSRCAIRVEATRPHSGYPTCGVGGAFLRSCDFFHIS
jgi:hypothetical protein